MKKSNFTAKHLSLTIPKRFTVIDTVTTDKNPIGSILLQHEKTGLYCLYNAGIEMSCSQREAREYVEKLKKENLK